MSKQHILMATILIAGAVTDTIFAYYVWRVREVKKGAAIGAAILLAGSIWMLCYAMEMLFFDFATKMFFKKVKHIGVYAFPVLWLIFSLVYTGREKWLTRRFLILFFIIPSVALVLVITNEFHEIYWSKVSFVNESGITVFEAQDTPYQFLLNSYMYILFFGGCLILLQELIKKPVLYRMHIKSTIFVFGIVLFIYAIRFYLLPTFQFIDLNPLLFALISIPFSMVFYRLRISNIVPAAHEIIIEGMRDPVIVLDNASCILKVNKAARSLIETESDQLIGLPVRQVIPEWLDHLSNAINEPNAPADISLIREGRQLIYNISISSLLDIRNNVISKVVVLRDITDIRQAEAELFSAYKKLQNTQAQLIQSGKLASIGQLASGVAHELNQPLMVIRALTQFLSRTLQKNKVGADQIIEQLEPIERNTKRMMNIIKHLQSFSRQSKKEYSSANINSVIEDSFVMIGEQLRLRNIEVIKNLSPDLPLVQCNTNQMEQVFLNIISNGRDAIVSKTERMGTNTEFIGKLEIMTRYELVEHDSQSTSHAEIPMDLASEPPPLPQKQVEILIKDNGTGMSPEVHKKIFDPFFTTKDVGMGTGLGLSISYGIIKDHGGEIEMAETGPAGTIFRIRLPISKSGRDQKAMTKNEL